MYEKRFFLMLRINSRSNTSESLWNHRSVLHYFLSNYLRIFVGSLGSFASALHYCSSHVANLPGEIGFVHPLFARKRFIHRVSDKSAICQFCEWHSFCSGRLCLLGSFPFRFYHSSEIEKEKNRIKP